MVKRAASAPEQEPEQAEYEKPSEGEHLFQVVDVREDIDDNPDIVHAKLEVCGGDEEGRTILNRLSLDDNWKGFFATRLFLKAIGQPYKGDNFPIDTNEWIGRQFYAEIVHNESKGKIYANIKEYNFEKQVEQAVERGSEQSTTNKPKEEIAWDD